MCSGLYAVFAQIECSVGTDAELVHLLAVEGKVKAYGVALRSRFDGIEVGIAVAVDYQF